jgi:hypothetical protein
MVLGILPAQLGGGGFLFSYFFPPSPTLPHFLFSQTPNGHVPIPYCAIFDLQRKGLGSFQCPIIHCLDFGAAGSRIQVSSPGSSLGGLHDHFVNPVAISLSNKDIAPLTAFMIGMCQFAPAVLAAFICHADDSLKSFTECSNYNHAAKGDT